MPTTTTHGAEHRPFTRYVLLGAKGFCMGASDVVPGVSGGTMAFILGIYEELIDAIRSFDLTTLRLLASFRFEAALRRIPWRFLMSVGTGIMLAVFSLSRVLGWLLENRPILIWSFFLGLICASVVTVSRHVDRWRPAQVLSAAGGTVGAYLLVGLVPVSTPEAPWFLFLCGALAICAMILPGISGSFILVLLGKYRYVLEAVTDRDFIVLGLVAAGAVVGIISFSRLLGTLLSRYHDLTVALLTGLMLGSLRKVWPWKETVRSMVDMKGRVVPLVQDNVLPAGFDSEVLAALILMAVGLLTMVLLDRLGGGGRGRD